MNRIDLTGQKFGEWTVIGPYTKKGGNSYWACRCSCGVVVDVFLGSLRNEKSKKCSACQSKWMKESGQARKNALKHGMHKSSEYSSWRRMLDRCYRESYEHYAMYGGRGIIVCKRWRDSFEEFLKDMGLKPTSRHTLDRIGTNGNYKPKNCRWATPKQQNRNKQKNLWVAYKGERVLLVEAVERFSILRYDTVKNRVLRGWDVADALHTPAGFRMDPATTGVQRDWVTYRGVRMPLIDAVKKAGAVAYHTAHSRIRRGWATEKALETPPQRHKGTPKTS